MARYPVIATLFFLVVTIYSLWTGSSPQLGFWGHIWHFVFGSLFTSLGLMGGELFVSIHRNSIDTGKMRRSSLDPTFLLA